MSRSRTSRPAFAKCAAMPLPITPAPMTPQRLMARIGLLMSYSFGARSLTRKGSGVDEGALHLLVECAESVPRARRLEGVRDHAERDERALEVRRVEEGAAPGRRGLVRAHGLFLSARLHREGERAIHPRPDLVIGGL